MLSFFSDSDEKVASLTHIKARVPKPYPIHDQNGQTQPKWTTLSLTKTAEKPYPLGRTYSYSPYKGAPPPPPPPPGCAQNAGSIQSHKGPLYHQVVDSPGRQGSSDITLSIRQPALPHTNYSTPHRTLLCDVPNSILRLLLSRGASGQERDLRRCSSSIQQSAFSHTTGQCLHDQNNDNKPQAQYRPFYI